MTTEEQRGRDREDANKAAFVQLVQMWLVKSDLTAWGCAQILQPPGKLSEPPKCFNAVDCEGFLLSEGKDLDL